MRFTIVKMKLQRAARYFRFAIRTPNRMRSAPAPTGAAKRDQNKDSKHDGNTHNGRFIADVA